MALLLFCVTHLSRKRLKQRQVLGELLAVSLLPSVEQTLLCILFILHIFSISMDARTLEIYMFLFSVDECFAYVCAPRACSTFVGQKRASEPFELESQSPHVNAENLTLVLCKQEQRTRLTTEPSLQLWMLAF